MLPFKLVYSDHYRLPLGEHVFPTQKYELVKQELLEEGVASTQDFLTPTPATEADVLLVHSHFYVDKLIEGTLTAREELALEIPYSHEAVQAFLWHTGGTILAAERALSDGVAFNLGGGFHHAYPDHGEGFCMIHDVAVAIRKLQKQGRIQRVMTLDCDVHQGNGTAVIFAKHRDENSEALPSRSTSTIGNRLSGTMLERGADDVFTISLHQENNYPLQKPPSSIDVNLPDGTTDSEYIAWLDNAISSGFRQFQPDLLCYIAGADPYKEDQLGGLNLTIDGLKHRDELVFQAARAKGIPVMVTFAGGYARKIQDTVRIHRNTVGAAKEVFSGAGKS
ncbi:histone deacetylase family protein [Candidatus Korobacter versatilis]|nr:histone deacetylase [Candidatus Koribacter versatilis]